MASAKENAWELSTSRGDVADRPMTNEPSSNSVAEFVELTKSESATTEPKPSSVVGEGSTFYESVVADSGATEMAASGFAAEAAEASETSESNSGGVRPIDQAVLELLRREGALSVPQLTDRLQVTATAVRQRLDRLVDLRMIERRKHSAGRGRPSYNYHLTSLGLRYAGVSYADLAMAMWHELTEMPNQRLRQRLLAKVSRRMGSWYRQEVRGEGIQQRMQSFVQVLGDRKIPASILDTGALPVLEMQACPYPDLVNEGRDRSVCEMEQNMLSEAMGQKMELSCCRLDGHHSCQFRPAAELPIVTTEISNDVASDSGPGSIQTKADLSS